MTEFLVLSIFSAAVIAVVLFVRRLAIRGRELRNR